MRRWLLLLCVVALFNFSTARAHADQDQVHFLHDIVVHDGETAHDLVCFLCSVQVDGSAHDVVTFLGSVHVRGHVEGDTVDFLGNVILEQDASIGGSLVVFGGDVHGRGSGSVGKDSVVFPLILLFIPIFILAGLVYLVRSLAMRNRMPYPPPPFPPGPPMPPPPMR
jgi:hypothetical protein